MKVFYNIDGLPKKVEKLNVIDLNQIPFKVKRLYYVTLGLGEHRGFHAHKNLRQFFICLSGTIQFNLSTGLETSEVVLTSTSDGFLINQMVWREYKSLAANSILLVLASDLYNESDYIRDFDEFRKYNHAIL